MASVRVVSGVFRAAWAACKGLSAAARGIVMTVVVMVGLLAAPVVATAQDQTLSSSATGKSHVLSTTGSQAAGHVIEVPAGTNFVREFSFWLSVDSGTGVVRPMIYEWDGFDTVGPKVWESASTYDITSNASTKTTFAVNVALDPNKQYVFLVHHVSDADVLVEYGQADDECGYAVLWPGNLTLTITPESDHEMRYQAVFTEAAPSIPTLTEWAMILMGLMLAGGAAIYIQRRRVEAF